MSIFKIFTKKETEPQANNNVIHLAFAKQEEDTVMTPGQEHYRVGVDSNGNTTLTVLHQSGSTTLTMNQSACVTMIKLLEATLDETS